jgi:hypothetical protein
LPNGTTDRIISIVPTWEEVAALPDPLDRAALANDLMWNAPSGRSAYRALRASSVAAAIDAGHSAEEISARLQVKPSDVAWMARADSEQWTIRAVTRSSPHPDGLAKIEPSASGS